MAKIRDSNAGIGQRSSRSYLRPSETGQTRLANWPLIALSLCLIKLQIC